MTEAERALEIDELLCAHYGAPFPPFGHRDPLSELVGSMLSHRTKNAVTRQAYLRLREVLPTWEKVIDAPTGDVQAAIAAVTFPEVKAPRIQAALSLVRERRGGELALDFLADLSVPDARAWLEEIPGVGAKTSAAVLNFSRLRMPALVVDTHHLRVAQRIGLVTPKASLDKAAARLQAFLPEGWDGQRVYDSHQGFMRHGQQLCHFHNPRCSGCPIRQGCDYGRPREPA